MKLKVLLAGALALFLFGCSKPAADNMAAKKDAAMNNAVSEMAAPQMAAPETAAPQESKAFKPFDVYTDKGSPANHYIPSGWMGDASDVSFDDAWTTDPHSGASCIKIVYSNVASTGARWAGIYWQNPANNWGSKKGGFDLTGATALSFWARGENGGERIEEFKMGGVTGQYPDSDVAGIGPVILTKEWKQYTIDLRGKDLSYISGGFAWSTNLDVDPDGATFYLDDIVYE
jgi:hypothetical protein